MEEAYKAWISWGFVPGDFWKIHPREFWWIVDVKRPRKKWGNKHPMSEEEVAYLYRKAEEKERGGHT